MSNIYAGGIPEGKDSLFPKASNEAEETAIPGGELKVKFAKGGPATNSGSKTKDFLDDASYGTGSLSTDNEPAMKIVNPDDISH